MVMVWEAVSYKGTVDLVGIEGKMNFSYYVDFLRWFFETKWRFYIERELDFSE